jgi:hypothetical protein
MAKHQFFDTTDPNFDKFCYINFVKAFFIARASYPAASSTFINLTDMNRV